MQLRRAPRLRRSRLYRQLLPRPRRRVADGRLTLTNGAGAYRNKICFIEIGSTASHAYPFLSYGAWSAANFAGGSADPAAAPAADPNRNGIPNPLEYASGGAPGLADFGFLRSAQELDAGYSVWETDDLVNWDLLWSNREDADFSSPLVSLADPAASGWVTLQLPLDADRPRHFFRLQVDLP